MLVIKDKEYDLRYPINTLCIMAEDGIDIMNIGNLRVNISTVRDLFYYGLKHENKKITKNQAGDIMDGFLEEGGSVAELIEIVMESLAKSLGRKTDDEEIAEDEEGK